MKIKFTKMQGIGNDYVYIDCYTKEIEIENVSEFAKKVSDRHFGIGADGVILICKSGYADFKMRMFNSDGSEAEMCGNGIRCVGKFVYDKKLTKKDEITVETLAGIKKLKLNVKNKKVKTVTVDMGEPILEPEKIPVMSREPIVRNLEIKILNKNFKFTCVSMGNPHTVTFVDNVVDIDVEKYGPIIENDGYFPHKTNVEFVEIIDKKHIMMRTWERGSGETLACGTGACAAVVASILNNITEYEVDVELLGGHLQIEWNRESNRVYMTGPAVTVFEGELDENGLQTIGDGVI